MFSEDIRSLIISLNSGEMNDRVFRVSLTKTVEFAKVWLEDPGSVEGISTSLKVYLIKDENGNYVSAVLDMGKDLLAFVMELYRKMGYLTKAMNETILPHLFQNGRSVQYVTFKDPKIGDYCAKNWGFTITGKNSGEKDLSIYRDIPKITLKRNLITREDFSNIKIKIYKAQGYLTMIKEQLEQAYGNHSETVLKNLLGELTWLDDDILSIIEDGQGRLK